MNDFMHDPREDAAIKRDEKLESMVNDWLGDSGHMLDVISDHSDFITKLFTKCYHGEIGHEELGSRLMCEIFATLEHDAEGLL